MRLFTALLATVLLLASSQAYSRNDKLMISIQDAFETSDYKNKLDPDIKFYFGEQKHAKVSKSYGVYSTSKKTNAFNKSDEEACRWAMLSALLTMQKRAINEGADAVINIVSYYDRHVVSSETEFECHAGTFMSGVAIQGKVAKLAK